MFYIVVCWQLLSFFLLSLFDDGGDGALEMWGVAKGLEKLRLLHPQLPQS